MPRFFTEQLIHTVPPLVKSLHKATRTLHPVSSSKGQSEEEEASGEKGEQDSEG